MCIVGISGRRDWIGGSLDSSSQFILCSECIRSLHCRTLCYGSSGTMAKREGFDMVRECAYLISTPVPHFVVLKTTVGETLVSEAIFCY